MSAKNKRFAEIIRDANLDVLSLDNILHRSIYYCLYSKSSVVTPMIKGCCGACVYVVMSSLAFAKPDICFNFYQRRRHLSTSIYLYSYNNMGLSFYLGKLY